MAAPDLEPLRAMLAAQLPVRARWLIDETPCDWDFSRAQQPLRPISLGADVPALWRGLYIFGEEDYAEGGGARSFIGINAEAGDVFGLDLERDEPLYVFNSTPQRFIDTFLLFDQALGQKSAAAIGLAARAQAIDPEAFERSEWRDAARHVERRLSAA
jgi:hypothetical protein